MTDSAAEAKKYALTLLSYKGRSERELQERLKGKGFSENNINAALGALKQAGYVNDLAYAEELARQARDNRLLGRPAALRYLLGRGIPEDIAEEVLSIDEEAEDNRLRKLIAKRLKTSGSYEEIGRDRRLWAFLARRGYKFSTIKSALKNFKKMEREE